MTDATSAISDAPGPIGAKARDYWWTVLVVDPVALPLVRLLFRRRWLTPDQTTWISFALGVLVGPAYGIGNRLGLISGAALFYVSFVFDCVDGKLARALGTTSPRGKILDEVADGGRRASASLGLIAYLWFRTSSSDAAVWLAVAFAVLAFYFMQISGGDRREFTSGIAGRWSSALARRRLLPNPGMPDVAGIVFVIGPLTGLVVPALVVGSALIAVGILRALWKLRR